MSRQRRSRAPKAERRKQGAPASEPPPASLEPRSSFVDAARDYFSGGLGLRANLILGSIALMGLLIFVLTSLAGPISDDDDDAGPGPTVFATRTPEAR